MNQFYRALHMPPKRLLRKVMGEKEIYTIAVRPRPTAEGTEPLPALGAGPYTLLPGREGWWFADPLLYRRGGRRWLFAEAMDLSTGKGRIEVCELHEDGTIDACRKIEAYFGFPAPNELVQKAEIPGGMYSNMVAQLKQLKAEDILPRAMELIPSVRLAAGLPPLVTPTSQIVGAQAVNCALDEKAGRPMYTNKSSQFVGLVKGEYGHTPVKIDPEFRFKICGVREETPYDTSKYQMQSNPELPEAGGVKLAANEKEVLLLELFPMVAKTFLTDMKVKAYAVAKPAEPKAEEKKAEEVKKIVITGNAVTAPLPGRIIELKVKVGDTVKAGDEIAVLEAMKMENSVTTDYAGTVKQVLVQPGENVATDAVLVEIG